MQSETITASREVIVRQMTAAGAMLLVALALMGAPILWHSLRKPFGFGLWQLPVAGFGLAISSAALLVRPFSIGPMWRPSMSIGAAERIGSRVKVFERFFDLHPSPLPPEW